MNINDINFRLKRVYRAVDKQIDPDINPNINVKMEQVGSQGRIELTFGKLDKTELINTIFGIIYSIASLKDHLKNKLKKVGKNPQLVENTINECLELQLIFDLWNQDKHGYPLERGSRSGKNPKLVNLRQGLTIKDTSKGSGSIVFSPFFPQNMHTVTSESDNMVVKIMGEIVDTNGKNLVSLDELFNKSLAELEKLIKLLP